MTALLLTWKESGWPHENLVRMARAIEERGYVDEPWCIAAHRVAKAGDRVWVLKQGRGRKGIFGAGHLQGQPSPGDAGDGTTRMMAPVRFGAFVDPKEKMLIGEEALKDVLRSTQVRAQANGYPLDDAESAALEKLLANGAQTEPVAAGQGMALSLNDHRAMLSGFAQAGYVCTQAPAGVANPVRIDWHGDGQVHSYRLWAFDITHGGGGPTVRAADEYRIQITNGPQARADLDQGGAVDLLVGYSHDRDAIVAYDRRWLERWIDRGGRGSPSVQVREADIQAGHNGGIHHITKDANFGQGHIVTMSPAMLPAYLRNHSAVLQGLMTAANAAATVPVSGTETIVDYCRRQGFPFEADIIARYIAALLTKPFVILAGVSGTGKSKLAELVAEFYTRTGSALAPGGNPAPGGSFVFVPAKGAPDRRRFALVAVRPDWIDNQSILGFVNPITTEYESTQALDLILRAREALGNAAEKPAAPRYFMLLDEMNLARVEHYFSDWLACTESRRLRPDGTIMQQAVPLYRSDKMLTAPVEELDGTKIPYEVPGFLELPTNIVVTGTVNVDETTYGFSPKVLDRAMVLEFDTVDLERLRTGAAEPEAATYRFPETLPGFRLASREDYEKLPPATHAHLVALNGILGEARLHLGYRAANEIALFMAIYNSILPASDTDTDWLRALDAAVLQKVLPRLAGNRAKLETPLAKICSYLRDARPPVGEVGEGEFDLAAPAALPKSYRRAVEMLESLRDFGFVSFFK